MGKSTLFNTITKMGIPAENFPFCTIEPNNVSGLPVGAEESGHKHASMRGMQHSVQGWSFRGADMVMYALNVICIIQCLNMLAIL